MVRLKTLFLHVVASLPLLQVEVQTLIGPIIITHSLVIYEKYMSASEYNYN